MLGSSSNVCPAKRFVLLAKAAVVADHYTQLVYSRNSIILGHKRYRMLDSCWLLSAVGSYSLSFGSCHLSNRRFEGILFIANIKSNNVPLCPVAYENNH